VQEPLQLAIIGFFSHEPPDAGQGSWQVREEARLRHRLDSGPHRAKQVAAVLAGGEVVGAAWSIQFAR
jgi:hypothetical protein